MFLAGCRRQGWRDGRCCPLSDKRDDTSENGTAGVTVRLTDATERYIEAIYILENTGGAIAARVADRLGVRAPSVTQALRRLEAAGWLVVTSDRSLHLTPRGTEAAEQVMRRHRVLERWLVEHLGLGWAQAHSEAQRMEHSVSPEVVDRLYLALGQPTACPHGNPIPGAQGLPSYAGSNTLDLAPSGTPLRVARIAEDAEEDVAFLARVDRMGLRPGATLEVIERGLLARIPAGGGAGITGATVQVRFAVEGTGEAILELQLAAKVWIDVQR